MLPVSPVHRGRLGLPDAIANPHVANGAGALRALVFEVRGDLRPAIEAAAGALAARPALLWMLVGMSRMERLPSLRSTLRDPAPG